MLMPMEARVGGLGSLSAAASVFSRITVVIILIIEVIVGGPA
jgi:hypothetical protein